MSWRGAFLGFCWVVIVAGVMVLVFTVLSMNAAKAGAGPTGKVTLTCPLAREVQESSLTRLTYLGGELEKATSTVEKITLAVEVEALEQLRRMMIVWRGVNCNKEKENG